MTLGPHTCSSAGLPIPPRGDLVQTGGEGGSLVCWFTHQTASMAQVDSGNTHSFPSIPQREHTRHHASGTGKGAPPLTVNARAFSCLSSAPIHLHSVQLEHDNELQYPPGTALAVQVPFLWQFLGGRRGTRPSETHTVLTCDLWGP